MNYTNPNMVRSPKNMIRNLNVIYDGGENSWSLASLNWDDTPSLGIRWNGNEENVGTPQSRGIPTWFILPEELHAEIHKATAELLSKKQEK